MRTSCWAPSRDTEPATSSATASRRRSSANLIAWSSSMSNSPMLLLLADGMESADISMFSTERSPQATGFFLFAPTESSCSGARGSCGVDVGGAAPCAASSANRLAAIVPDCPALAEACNMEAPSGSCGSGTPFAFGVCNGSGSCRFSAAEVLTASGAWLDPPDCCGIAVVKYCFNSSNRCPIFSTSPTSIFCKRSCMNMRYIRWSCDWAVARASTNSSYCNSPESSTSINRKSSSKSFFRTCISARVSRTMGLFM
mmetsp:Transcript_30231/g.87102  ORF Transcript_30231/g.87102 Transcript_30231/m.87102 type:complete len:256 (+) Transcript_30231:504-1271(+)